jgi:acetylornithine deacetylase
MQIRMLPSEVREIRVEERLAELVAFDTRNPGGDERPLAEKLARDLTTLGAQTVEILSCEGHASTFARFGSNEPTLILNAHIDTVPANAGWTRDPWQLAREGERVHGLGSADTKGAIAAILTALAQNQAESQSVDGVAVLFSGDEELGGICIREFLASDRIRGLRRALVCEPTGCRVGARHRGVYAARLTATSPGGHSSLAETVPNPLTKLAHAAVALDELGERCRFLGPAGLRGICMNIAALDGGMAFNIIPASATLTFSMRPAPGVKIEPILDEARAAVETATAPLSTTWQPIAGNPAFETQSLADFAALLGERTQAPIDLPFGTEAGQFVEKGIDAVVIGPGRVEQAHKADEYVDLDELEEAVRIFRQVIR